MTSGELRRREQAVIAGFVELDGNKAFRYVKEIIDINANDGVLFRFRPHKQYEIDTLESKKYSYVDHRFMKTAVTVKYFLT